MCQEIEGALHMLCKVKHTGTLFVNVHMAKTPLPSEQVRLDNIKELPPLAFLIYTMAQGASSIRLWVQLM